MADQFYAPIVVIPSSPPECRPQLPQIELSDDLSQVQGWPTSSNDTYNKDTLRLQISSYPNHRAQPSPYLSSPVSPTPYLSSPISPTSSTLSLSPSGLTAAFNDITLVEELSPEDSFPWNLEQNILHDPSSLSRGGNTPSDGLNLTISAANDQVNNAYPSSATSEEDFNEIFNQTISLNFEESSNTADHDPSPSQTDFGTYMSPQYGEGADSFFAPHSPGAFTADLLPTTSNVNEGTLQRRYSHSHAIVSKSHPECGATGSLLIPPDGHDDGRQLRHHSRSHSNSCIGLMTSNIGAPSPSSLLSPEVALAESNQLHRRHSHSSASQRSMETVVQPLRRVKSMHSRSSPYARPQDIGPADAYPTPNSDDHRLFCNDTRTPEHSAPPSPLPPSSPHSRNVMQPNEDMFRRYDNASGIGYPILQRETIASDAVLQASAKRRKKVASYECKTCGQMLTSRDNLNNHMDAHTGIRRHRCDYCHERFRTRSVLKRHQKSIKCPASRLDSSPKKKPNDTSSLQVPPS